MKTKKYIFIIILLLVSLLTTTSNANTYSISETSKNNVITNVTETDKYKILEKKLDIKSEAVILIDSKSGTEIYSKNADKKMYPASTTKVLTAILVLENGNIEDMTTVSHSAIAPIPSGYSSAYLSEGEVISVKNLLEVLLVHSANDAANVLAEYISGSIDDFVELMNKKATELGCKNTHFTNTNGIQDKAHYSTASDLAIISKYCMQNQTFRNMVSMKKCVIPATNKSEQRFYKNTNDAILDNSKYYRKDCIGIKTGYTSQAKNCLLAAVQDDDIELIAVLLYSPHLVDRYTDLNTLFDYGYEAYPALDITPQVEEIPQTDETFQAEDTSSISTENLFSQSFFEKLIQNNIFIIVLRVLLVIAILGLVGMILSININY